MRILHVLDHSLPLHSGYSFRTLAILESQRALGWETVQVTTPRQGGGRGREELVEGWLFHRTPGPRRGWTLVPGLVYVAEMTATARRLEELAEEFTPDVIHAHSPVLTVLPAIRIGRRRKIPVVYEVRALWEDAAVDHGVTREGSVRYRLSRALETYALRRAGHVTVICEGLRKEVAARGLAADKITVIPNAVDPLRFRFLAEPEPGLRTRLGLDGCTVIGFAGSFFHYEGLDLLVEGLQHLAPSWPQLKLLLVGGGPQEVALRAQVAAAGLGQRAVFAGRVPHAEIRRYYELMDLLACPRRSMRLTEIVTPLKPLEGMAQGCVVVASDVGGHRELVKDGETGFLFRAGDAGALAGTIGSVLSHLDRWPLVRENARRFVEFERTWERSVSGYAEVYGRLE